VIIPVLREPDRINACIAGLAPAGLGPDRAQVIVADGSPAGDTIKAIENIEVVGLIAPTGRASQMNRAARAADGDILLFLHADSRLPAAADLAVRAALADGRTAAGAFGLAIDSGRPGLGLIAAMATLRSRLTRIPYGDQAIFIRRDHFLALGGYADIPLMEDVELMTRLRRRGDRVAVLPQRVLTSARRWESEGAVYCTLRNWSLFTLYRLGVGPDRLAGWYRFPREAGSRDGEGRAGK
jgi:rSAM/selenodomain-associated transferase 2